MIRIFIALLLLGQFVYSQTITRENTIMPTNIIVRDSARSSPNSDFNTTIKHPSIDRSKAKVDIRLYKYFILTNTTELRRIFFFNNVWRASEFVGTNNPPKIRKYSLTAKPNFDTILKKLISLKIMTLPNQSELNDKMKKITQVWEDGTTTEDKMIMTDGIAYTIEIKIGDKYRIYQFSNPEGYAEFYDNVSELQDYVQIVQIFEKELKRNNNR